MAIDITQLAKQFQSPRQAKGGARSAIQSVLEEQERWRKQLLQPSYAMRSILDQLNEQQDLVRQHRKLLFSPAQLALNEIIERQHKLDRLADALGPSSAFLDMIEQNRRLVDQVARFSDPFHDVIERFKLDQVAPWASQLQAATEHVQKLLQSLPADEDFDDAALDWDTLGGQLQDVHAAIERLPLTGATDQQVRASGMSRGEWVATFLALLGIVVAILGMLQTQVQGRLARDQAAEEQAYRERADQEERAYRQHLLAAIEALAERSPRQQEHYVVGTRAVRVKSQIRNGIYLDTAHPNQVVVATGKSGRWLKIRYRNHLQDREVEGWVLKHYLVRHPGTAGPG